METSGCLWVVSPRDGRAASVATCVEPKARPMASMAGTENPTTIGPVFIGLGAMRFVVEGSNVWKAKCS